MQNELVKAAFILLVVDVIVFVCVCVLWLSVCVHKPDKSRYVFSRGGSNNFTLEMPNFVYGIEVAVESKSKRL
jgi:hypothetical protein